MPITRGARTSSVIVQSAIGVRSSQASICAIRLLAALSEPDASSLFRALCCDLIISRRPSLVAIGTPALLVPSFACLDAASPIPNLPRARFDSSQTTCVPHEEREYGWVQWASLLWTECGLGGVLMLGEKNDGGMHGEEEIEIARASGKRSIDVKGNTEPARRLMALHLERLAERHLLDCRARRVLCDDVAPQPDAAMLTLNSSNGTRAPKNWAWKRSLLIRRLNSYLPHITRFRICFTRRRSRQMSPRSVQRVRWVRLWKTRISRSSP